MMRSLTQSHAVTLCVWVGSAHPNEPHTVRLLHSNAHCEWSVCCSHRLATHLSCAFVIYSSLLYSALSLVLPKLAAPSAAALPAALAAHPRVRALRAMTLGSAALIGTTIVSGTALARYTLFAEPHMVCVIPPLWRGVLCVAPLQAVHGVLEVSH